MFDRPSRTRRRLAALSAEIQGHRDRLAVLDEQVAFLRGVDDDAETAALVSGPEAVREHAVTSRDLARAVRERDEVAEALQQARAQQDALLESLLDGA